MNNHSALVNSVLLWLGQDYRHIRAWKNHTGQAYTFESFERFEKALREGTPYNDAKRMLTRISYGNVGSADISGLMLPHGQRIEIECKTGTGRQTADQINYMNMIRSLGGIYILCRQRSDLEILKAA